MNHPISTCSLFCVARKDKEHLCCCYKRASCLCQCSIWTAESRLWHVIWHCIDTMVILEVDITVSPAGGYFVQWGAKWNTGLRATAHTCMWKQAPLGQADAFVHIDGSRHQVKMCLAGKCFLFPPKSSLPIKTHVASLKKEGTISPDSWVTWPNIPWWQLQPQRLTLHPPGHHLQSSASLSTPCKSWHWQNVWKCP